MIEFEKMCTLNIGNLYYLGVYQMIEILSSLYSPYIVAKDQDKFVFYINNYINLD